MCLPAEQQPKDVLSLQNALCSVLKKRALCWYDISSIMKIAFAAVILTSQHNFLPGLENDFINSRGSCE